MRPLNTNAVVVEVSANTVTLANGSSKQIPAIFSKFKDEEKQYEAIERFVRGNLWAKPGDEVLVVL